MAVDPLFDADHAPGSMKLSASLWPTLVLPPQLRPGWLPSPLAYALHLIGVRGLPSIDPKLARRGHWAERMGAGLLVEDQGWTVSTPPENIGRLRRNRPDVPAVANLDGLLFERQGWAVEFKSVQRRLFREQWADSPPWYPRVQVQCQMAVDQELLGVLIVPIVLDSSDCPSVPAVYEEPRNDDTVDMLLEVGRDFIVRLESGWLPEPDETPSSYQAILETLKLEQDEAVVLAEEQDAKQFVWWQQAKHQERAGAAMQEASKRYFMARAGNASVIEIPSVGRITRKQVAVKAESEPRPARVDLRWNLKEDNET